MATFEIPDINTTGLDSAYLQVSSSVSTFTPFLLLFIFMVVLITGYKKQKQESGNGDIPLWGTIAGVVTSVVALILSTKAGMIDTLTLITPIVITIIMGIWLFSSNDKQ